MALDVYVMPLHRFKAGDFRSPIEIATGIQPTIVVPDAQEPERRGWFHWFRRALPVDPDAETAVVDVRQAVEAVQQAVEVANGSPISWRDEGDVVYSCQSLGFEPLQAFAKWLDCRDQFPNFGPAPGGKYHNHPVMAAEVKRLSCPHLVEHDCYSGYYLPCEFERLVEVEPYLAFGQWPASRSVGSAPRLLRELDCVQSVLRLPEGYEYRADDPLVAVKAAYLQLREVAEFSCRHGLPIIFWG